MRRSSLLIVVLTVLAALVAGALWLVLSDPAGDSGNPKGANDPRGPSTEIVDPPRSTSGARARVRSAAGGDAAEEREISADDEIDGFGIRVVTVGSERPVRGLVFDVFDQFGLADVSSDEARAVRTNRDGIAVIRPQSDSESRVVVSSHAPGAEQITLERGLRTVHVPPPVPVEVRYIDANTGQPIVGGSRGRADGDLFPVWPGQTFDFRFPPFRAPDGYSSPTGPQRRRRGRLSPFAVRAIATVPVAREAKIRVQVVNEHGLVVPKATATVAMLTGPIRAVATDENGEAQIGSMPFHRGELVYTAARYKKAGGTAEPVALRAADDEVVIQVLLDDKVRGFRPPRPSEENEQDRGDIEPAEDPGGTASIAVNVRRRDGTRAAQAEVELDGPWTARAPADENGVAHFDGLPAGKYRIACIETGMNAAWATVEIGAGEEHTVDLKEPVGRPLTVRVVDATGAPLPFASVSIDGLRGSTWTRMEGGDQHLDIFTDATGEVALGAVPEGAVSVRATYGSRSTTAEAGQDALLVITIRDASVE